jgi:hypothetical protein
MLSAIVVGFKELITGPFEKFAAQLSRTCGPVIPQKFSRFRRLIR